MNNSPWRIALAAAAVSAVTGLSACGGGGAAEALPVVATPTPVPTKACVNNPGNLDRIESTLSGLLATTAGQLPQIGGVAATATQSLAWSLDAIDAILNATETLARTQDPTAFISELTGSGDSLLCAGSTLSDSLNQLVRLNPLGAPIPGLALVQTSLAQVTARVRDGLTGQVPGGDLRALTDQLAVLADALETLSASLPANVNQPYLRSLLELNATAFSTLAAVLDDVGALDGEQLVADLTGLLDATLVTLPTSLAGQLGIPASVLAPLTTQVQAVTQQFQATTAVIVAPVFTAVSTVLGASVGQTNVSGSISDLIDGALSGVIQTPVSQVANLLQGGGTGPGGQVVPTLLNTLLGNLGGVLPGGRG